MFRNNFWIYVGESIIYICIYNRFSFKSNFSYKYNFALNCRNKSTADDANFFFQSPFAISSHASCSLASSLRPIDYTLPRSDFKLILLSGFYSGLNTIVFRQNGWAFFFAGISSYAWCCWERRLRFRLGRIAWKTCHNRWYLYNKSISGECRNKRSSNLDYSTRWRKRD